MRKGNLESFIERANMIHNNKYNYDKVIENEPKSVKDKIIITCPIHGDFETTFDQHVNKKSGCPICNRGKRRTTKEFINECKEIHKGKNYDYSKVKFTAIKNKVTVICHEKNILGEEHGEFEVRADHFLHGHGCPKCAHRYLTTAEVVEMARRVHGDKYDYSLVEYKNNNSERLPIICHEKDDEGNEHGIFSPVWSSHLVGIECPKCNGGVSWDKEKFVKEAIKKHGNRYNYDKFVYVNATTKGVITCPRHGDFLQTPYCHARVGEGCPKCKSSRLESITRSVLNKNGIVNDEQVEIGLGKKTVDFYLPGRKIYIECQGEQHYFPTKYGSNKSDEEAEKDFEERVELDKVKYDKVTELGCEMIYFTLPNDFHVDGINVFDGFYSDKKVFTDTKELVKYILKHDANDECDDDLCNFISEVRKIKPDIIVTGNKIKYNGSLIYFNDLNSSNSSKIMERHRSCIRRGYKTIDIFADEWEVRKDIVLSKVRHLLGADIGIEKINARKCTIDKITFSSASEFLDANHIQGSVSSTLYYGCFYNGKLVAVMTFLEESNGYWNLTRFATLMGTLCRGVASKMLKRFIDENKPVEIKSFADKRWTSSNMNNLYTKLGFEYDGESVKPEYRYYKKGETKERLHKFRFRKQILHKKYGFPLSMTELEMTRELGYDRIWDCGLYKYVWRNPDNGIRTEVVEME